MLVVCIIHYSLQVALIVAHLHLKFKYVFIHRTKNITYLHIALPVNSNVNIDAKINKNILKHNCKRIFGYKKPDIVRTSARYPARIIVCIVSTNNSFPW